MLVRLMLFSTFLLLRITLLYGQENEVLFEDSLYVCTYDGADDYFSLPIKNKIYPARDQVIISLCKELEYNVRSANYLVFFEGDFISTAGACWVRENQALVYNPIRFKEIRNLKRKNGQKLDADSVELLFKGIVLHEINHHLCSHSILRKLKKTNTAESIVQYETEADRFMGQALFELGHNQNEAKYVIEMLVNSSDKQIVPKKDRLKAVIVGWKNGEKKRAEADRRRKSNALYAAHTKIQGVKGLHDQPDNNWKSKQIPVYEKQENFPEETMSVYQSGESAKFKIVKENEDQFLEADIAFIGYKRLARIADSNIPKFKLMAYDEYFVFWYITEDNQVYSSLDGNYYYMGSVEN